jgi:hypothetical protein
MTIVLAFLTTLITCENSRELHLSSPINLTHALNLVDSVKVGDDYIYYITIYADAPQYQPVQAVGEGVSCVDDVGRFLEVLEREIVLYKNTSLMPVALGMTRFLLYLSCNDGKWYNFLYRDGTINKTHRNSIADFSWWAVRGLRGLAASYNILSNNDVNPELKKAVFERIQTMDTHLREVLSRYPQKKAELFGSRPTWLIKNAPDLNSELLMVLVKLTKTGDFDYSAEIRKVAEGLIDYQYSNEKSNLNGMYFCWNNSWHNWGNNQAAALIQAYQITGENQYLNSIRLWANHFVPFIIEHDFPWQITVESNMSYQIENYPQIAYGIHSIYHGIQALAKVTGDQYYENLAEQVFGWFKGQNVAGSPIYDSLTGRCYDGIDNDGKVNFNSGAESTIECLLAIQERGHY